MMNMVKFCFEMNDFRGRGLSGLNFFFESMSLRMNHQTAIDGECQHDNEKNHFKR